MADADFLRAIAENPDDDTPRLVYADWLDEHGDAAGRGRAELIRAQCELGRDPKPARRKELTGQVRAILKAHAEGWLKPLRAAGFTLTPRFRRGLPEHVTMSATNFVHAADRLLRAVPTVRAARFPNAANEVGRRGRLAASPNLARLAELDLHDMCNCGHCQIGEELRELFASPHAANLSALNVAGNRIDAGGVRALAASPHLPRLRSLDLSRNAIGPTGGRVLAASPALRLTTLNLAGNRVGDVGGRAFAAADRPEPWQLLDLRDNGIGPAVARRLRDRFGKAVKV